MRILLLLALGGLLLCPELVRAQGRDVTAAQVNGTWESKTGVFKIWALGGQKLQVEFSGVYEYKLADGSPMANAGAGSGIAVITGQTAKFKPDGAAEGDLITLEFVHGRLEVTQQGACGFGKHVTAEGTYRKTDAHQPKFGQD